LKNLFKGWNEASWGHLYEEILVIINTLSLVLLSTFIIYSEVLGFKMYSLFIFVGIMQLIRALIWIDVFAMRRKQRREMEPIDIVSHLDHKITRFLPKLKLRNIDHVVHELRNDLENFKQNIIGKSIKEEDGCYSLQISTHTENDYSTYSAKLFKIPPEVCEAYMNAIEEEIKFLQAQIEAK